MLLTKENFKYQKEYAYDGNDKYPRYILRGKKISKELAEKIIVTETEKSFLESNQKLLNCDLDSIKKPLSISETIEYEERQKEIYGEENLIEGDSDNNQDFENWFTNQSFITNTPITRFVDAKGFVGDNFNTTKYPDPYEFLVEHLEYANRYPFLSYVIIYADYDMSSYENRLVNDLYPPFFDDIEQKFEAFTYALHVHNGGVEVVNKKEAIKLYKKYQKEYSNNLIFSRKDYDEYIKNTFTYDYIPLILKNWEINDKIKKEIGDAYKVTDKKNGIVNWMKWHKKDLTDKMYMEYKDMSKELEKICTGKKTKLEIDENVYNELKDYFAIVFKYHERMNKVKDLEKQLKPLLKRADYDMLRDVVYVYKYNRKSIELEFKNEKKKQKNKCSIPLFEQRYFTRLKMYEELEHIRNGESTKLKYSKVVINKLKQYLNNILDEDGNEKERKELDIIWRMERDLQLKIDSKTYKLITDTILYTKNSNYDLEKEYKIYCDGREISISFMKDIKNAVKNKDYELKTIDEKAYIKKYKKIEKEYKTLVDTCLYYY